MSLFLELHFLLLLKEGVYFNNHAFWPHCNVLFFFFFRVAYGDKISPIFYE